MLPSLSSWISDLFRQHHSDAVRFASRLVGNRDNGEEIVQNAWMKICGRKSISEVLHPKAYLFTATRHAAIDFALIDQREQKYRVCADSLDEAEIADDTLQLYERRQQLAVIAISLNDLPKACRKAFVMNKLEGKTHPVIAMELGISVSMVEKHVVRALLHCRALMLESKNR